MGIEGILEKGVVTTTADKLINWAVGTCQIFPEDIGSPINISIHQ